MRKNTSNVITPSDEAISRVNKIREKLAQLQVSQKTCDSGTYLEPGIALKTQLKVRKSVLGMQASAYKAQQKLLDALA